MTKYQDFIEGIIHGLNFEVLQALETAVEFNRNIPKFYLEANNYYVELGIGKTKTEARQARQQLIEEIVYAILHQTETKYGEKMLPDNYARLFHGLAILNLEKDSPLLPSCGNFIYNFVYELWKLDNGSYKTGEEMISTCWYLAEAIKKEDSLSTNTCS